MDLSFKPTVKQVVLSNSENACPICKAASDSKEVYLSMYSISGNKTIKVAASLFFCKHCEIYFSDYQTIHQLNLYHQKCRVYSYCIDAVNKPVPLVEDIFLVQDESICPNCGTYSTHMPVHIVTDAAPKQVNLVKCRLPYCYRCGYFFASKKSIQIIETNCLPFKIKVIQPIFITKKPTDQEVIITQSTKVVVSQSRPSSSEPFRNQQADKLSRIKDAAKTSLTGRCSVRGCNSTIYNKGLCWEHYKHDNYEVK